MKKVTLFVVLVLSFSVCACSSKRPPLVVDNSCGCIEYQQSVSGDDVQTLRNAEMQEYFKSLLVAGLANNGLRLCEKSEDSEYYIAVSEVRRDFKTQTFSPSVVGSTGFPIFDLISDAVIHVAVVGGKKAYREANDIDYEIMYTARFGKKGKGIEATWKDFDSGTRDHYDEWTDKDEDDLYEHYAEVAEKLIVGISKTPGVK